ncbi:hypothetical protein CK1_10740 [Ruminococcus sp. SR1/5]|nr:hypothetical protein CK1_10740 [Ruminococcus sp. SR1/5]
MVELIVGKKGKGKQKYC